MRTDSYIIQVRAAQRTGGSFPRDVMTAAEVGRILLRRLEDEKLLGTNLLVEAEIIVGDIRDEQPVKSVNIQEVESRVGHLLPFRRTA